MKGWVLVAMLIGVATTPAFAQTPGAAIELGGHVTVIQLSEFDVTDTGVGITAAWRATPIFLVDGAFTWFPGDGGSSSTRIARQQRSLGLVGVRSGIRRGRIELFGRARAGFLRFSPLEGAVCVAVTTVPLPLECQIATGYMSFATDLGGGIAVAAADRVHVRVEAGNLMVRYGQEAHRSNGELSDGFTSQSIQVSSAIVWRF
jgi:hypothetical protein